MPITIWHISHIISYSRSYLSGTPNIPFICTGRGKSNSNSGAPVQHAPLEPPPMLAGNQPDLMSATDDYYEGDNQDANDPDTYMKEEGQEVSNTVDFNWFISIFIAITSKKLHSFMIVHKTICIFFQDDQTIPFEEDEGNEEGGKKKGFKRFWRGPGGMPG